MTFEEIGIEHKYISAIEEMGFKDPMPVQEKVIPHLIQKDCDDLIALAQTGTLGSVIPAAWNFMLAARARGLGTAWTTLHLMQEKEVADIIGIPFDDYMQVALIPVAYTKGTSFKPAYRPPVESVMHLNEW